MSVPSLDQLLHSFDAALTDEIAVLHDTAARSSSSPVTSSHRPSQDCPTSHNLALHPEEEIPEPVEEVRPLVTSVDLLHRLQERLHVIGRHPTDWSTPLALKAVSPNSHPDTITFPPTLFEEDSLDASQREAYRRALTDDLLFLWGPPGTGKTRVIGQILQSALHRGLRVLLCSTTNAAVDHALDGVLENLQEDHADTILRVGTPSADASPRIHSVTLTEQLHERAAPLREKYTQLQTIVTTIDTEIEELRKELEQVNEREQHSRQISALMRDRNRIDRSLTDVQNQIQRITAQRGLLQKKLPAIFSWTNWLWPRRRKNLLKAIATHNQTLQSLHSKARTLLKAFSTLEDQLAKAQRQEYDRAAEGLCDDQRRSTFEIYDALRQAEAQLTDIQAQLESLRMTLQGLERELVHDAQVVATTLTRASCFRLFESERFDMVIVDEASLASLPALFATLCLATEHVVLVGDFLQNPPIARNTSSPSAQWLTQSIYDLAEIQNHHDPRVVALSTQYRMHPDIGDLAGTLYRQRGLPFHSADFLFDTREAVVSLPPFPHAPLAIVDTTSACPQIQRDERGSPRNLYHARIVLRLIAQTLLNQDPTSTPLTIAVMSPYRAQTTVLERCVKLHGWESNVHVGTIHQCQGQQFDVVIFDTTIINNLRQSFLCRTQSTSGGTRLLNVAMTRAKSKLILVGHARALTALPPETFLRTCFDYTCLHGVTLNSAQMIPPLSDAAPDRWWHDDQLPSLFPDHSSPPFLTTV
ncbi:MAG: hypothetical protein NPIRA04_03310 [Nitrospirales bacterium]|nr:MAG: hypothetical protein NPIRA04_03310 [Nitrospirales bacterium]